MEKATKQVRIHRPIYGLNDFKTIHPEIAKEWHPTMNSMLASEITSGSSKKYWWMCKAGHEFQATAASRGMKQHGCPYCTNHFVLSGFNDIKTLYPEVAKQWHPVLNGAILPSSVLATSTKKYWWVGQCGHIWESKPLHRASGTGCPFCSGNRVLSGFNDFATKFPELTKEWHSIKNNDMEPSMVSYASNKKAWWMCMEGHEWQTVISNRTFGAGCPSCSKSGYNQSRSSMFYFLSNDELNVRKIGITHSKSKRVKGLCNKGWSVVYSIDNGDGALINKLETEMKRWIKKEHGLLPVLNSKDMGSLGGWTETFSYDVLSNDEIIIKIEECWNSINSTR